MGKACKPTRENCRYSEHCDITPCTCDNWKPKVVITDKMGIDKPKDSNCRTCVIVCRNQGKNKIVGCDNFKEENKPKNEIWYYCPAIDKLKRYICNDCVSCVSSKKSFPDCDKKYLVTEAKNG